MLPILRGKPVLQVIKAMASEAMHTTIYFSGLLVVQAMAPTKKSPPRMKSVHLVALVSSHKSNRTTKSSPGLLVALVSAPPESNRTTKKSPPGVFLVVTKESLPACPRQLNP